MENRTIYQYRLFCETEQTYITIWALTEPTICTNNIDHIVNTNLTTILDKISNNIVSIKEEVIPTGGYFKFDMFKLIAPKNQTTTQFFSFPYPVNVIAAKLITGPEHQGDVLCWGISPNTTVGALTNLYTALAIWENQNYIVNDTVWYQANDIHFGSNFKCIKNTLKNENPTNTTYWEKMTIILNVSSTVTSYTKIGFVISLTDGVNKSDVGYVTQINSADGLLTVSGAPQISYSPLSPTYVQMTIMYMDHVELGTGMNISIGGDKIGASYVPVGVKIMAVYENKSNIDKILINYIEYLY